MDISPFSAFNYDNEDAWNDFLLVNATAHTSYNTALELLGLPVSGYPIADLGDTKEAQENWLHDHALMHSALTSTIGLAASADLTDVEIHDDDEFQSWLQIHQQQHQLIDAALKL